jgi:hypothetical protein
VSANFFFQQEIIKLIDFGKYVNPYNESLTNCTSTDKCWESAIDLDIFSNYI